MPRPPFCAAIVAAVTLLVAGRVVFHGFVLHDDPHEICANPLFLPLSEESWRRIWSGPDFSAIYIPVSYSALAALTWLTRKWQDVGGLTAPGAFLFHLGGLLLHMANSLLVLRLLRILVSSRENEGGGFPAQWGTLLGALFFAAHPVQVEAYARAGNITVTLGGFFGLSALLLEVRAVQNGRLWASTAATILYLLALLTRPSLVLWPLMALAVGFVIDPRRWRLPLVFLVGRLAAGAAYVLLTLNWQSGRMAALGGEIEWWRRPFVAADSLIWYAAQVVFPAKLTIDHGRTPQVVLSSPTYWVAGVAVLALAWLCWRWARSGQRLAALGMAIFWLSLLPVSGLIPAPARENFSLVYDRHLYFALFGAALLAVAALDKVRDAARLPMAALVLGSLAWLSADYLSKWRDSVSLFAHVVKVNPKSWYGHGLLGTALLNASQPAAALPHFEAALRLNPQATEAYVNAGQALLELGELDKATGVLTQAVKTRPDDPNAHNNLAVAAMQSGNWELAEAEAKKTIALAPWMAQGWNNLAIVLGKKGAFEEALLHHQRAIEIAPQWPAAYMAYGRTLVAAGQSSDGRRMMRRAVQMAPQAHSWRQPGEVLHQGVGGVKVGG